MQTITALSTQKKNTNRVNVFLDGAFAFGLPYSLAANLLVGQELTKETIDSLQQLDLQERAKNDAINLITRRPRSIAEISRYLDRKDYDEQVIEAAIKRLQEVNLLDDEAFAQYWVEQRETFRPRSRIALQQELRQKGINRAIIETALEVVDETTAARRAAEKKSRLWANLPQKEFRLKLGQFLQRRGFHYEIIKQVIDDIWHSRVQERNLEEDAIE